MYFILTVLRAFPDLGESLAENFRGGIWLLSKGNAKDLIGRGPSVEERVGQVPVL